MFKWKVSTLGRKNPSSRPKSKPDNLNNAPKAGDIRGTLSKEALNRKHDNIAVYEDGNLDVQRENGIFCYSGFGRQEDTNSSPVDMSYDNADTTSRFEDQRNGTPPLVQGEESTSKSELQKMHPAHSRDNPSVSQSWDEWTQQLQAYTLWVNSQLRKRANLPLIKDLAFDLQDGVLLFHLIDILANKTVPGVKLEPKCLSDRRQNFESLLQFLRTQNVKLPVNITARELVEGNLKAILRLILSIASHYKPLSVQQGRGLRSQITPNLNAMDNRKFLSHDESSNRVQAFATLRRPPKLPPKNTHVQSRPVPQNLASSDAGERTPRRTHSFRSKEEPLFNGKSSKRPPQVQVKTPIRSVSQDRAKPKPATTESENLEDLDSWKRELPSLGVSSLTNKRKPAALEFWKSQSSGESKNIRRALPALPSQKKEEANDKNAISVVEIHVDSVSSDDVSLPSEQKESVEESMEFEDREVEGSSQQTSPCTSVAHGPIYSHPNALHCVKQSMRQFHTSITLNDDDKKSAPYEVLLEDLHRTRQQLIDLQKLLLNSVEVERPKESRGTCTVSEEAVFAVLQSRLQNVDKRCNALQNEFHKAKEECMNMEGNQSALAVILNEQEVAMAQIHQELLACTVQNQNLIREKIELQRKLEEKDRQIADLKRQLGVKDRLVQNHKITSDDATRSLQRPVMDRTYGSSQSATRYHQNREELQVAREALSSLRTNFKSQDPNHHTLDTLEQCIAVMLERVEIHPEESAICESHFQSQSGYGRIGSGVYQGANEALVTKVVYYTDRTVTPFMSVVPRRLGDITLRDFKIVFDRPGFYRYYFKAPDPEYGFLKEEIINDDTILPGFEGKIIAWVEEDHSVYT